MEKDLNIVKVNNLSVAFPSRKNPNPKPVLDNLGFSIRRGEILGLIGNSGSGKSMTSLAISGLLPYGAKTISGEILFDGENLLTKTDKERRAMLGSDIGFIFQEPATALEPLMTIGKNLEEILEAHGMKDKNKNKETIISILETVGFTNPEDIMSRYPHQLSGGQRQRVLIAGASMLSPKLLICDEPTSALDTVTTVQVLSLIKKLCVELKITILFISHDLSVVNNFCDRVMVMKDGKIVDSDNTEDILSNPKNAYTAELLTNARLDPASLNLKRSDVDYSKSPILVAKDIEASYDKEPVLKKVSFEIYPNEILGLIGSSGCGKTTLSKTICNLMPYTGTITLKDKPGVVFQDPVTCLNPAHTVMWHLTEPLKAKKIKLSKEELNKKLIHALEEVGLGEQYLARYPNQLSGGQRQRVAIAMCLILEPKLIIADEPFSSLDASSAAGILKLLTEINRTRKTAILMVSHNLHVVRAVCSRVIVMDKGEIVEEGITNEVLSNPQHNQTKALLNAENTIHN